MPSGANPLLVRQHADELVILWDRRAALWQAPGATMDDLRDLDVQAEAHLQGLRLAGLAGWQLIEARCNGLPDPAALGALAYLAVCEDIEARLALLAARLTQDEGRLPALAQAAAIGICWHGAAYAAQVAPLFLREASIAQQLIGLQICALIGHFPADAVASALAGSAPLRPVALQLAGWGGLRALEPQLADLPPDRDIEGERSRRIALTLLTADPAHLAEWPDPGREERILTALLTPAEVWQGWPARYPEGTPAPREVIEAAGWIGAPALVPWLIGQMQLPASRASAADSLRRILGTDPEALFPPPTAPPPPDPFGLPAPAPVPEGEKLHQWWQAHPLARSEGALVLGCPFEPGAMQKLLRDCRLEDHLWLRLRARLAFGPQRHGPGEAPFPLLLAA